MIEKYGSYNSIYKQVAADNGTLADQYGWGYYGKLMNDLLNISDYTEYTYCKASYSYGSLPNQEGSYFGASSNKLGLPATWPTDVTQYALADFEGLKHTNYLKQVTQTDSYSKCPTMASLLKSFLESNDGYGFDDWYIPACGQLALLYVYKSDINSALSAMGGLTLSEDHWSSSEAGLSYGWRVCMTTGFVSSYNLKYVGYYVRFIRDL